MICIIRILTFVYLVSTLSLLLSHCFTTSFLKILLLESIFSEVQPNWSEQFNFLRQFKIPDVLFSN